VYIDRDDAQVVRMALNFTRAAFRDPALEDLFVIVENGLIGARFWLPRRQEIEIRRGGTWLDYPVRGIIRGRWEIGDYEVNTGLNRAFFAGPEIVLAPRAVQDTFHFGGRVLDSLPSDVRAVTDDDIRQVQAEARALVRAQALQRPQTLMLSAVGASDFLRFDRAEGLAFGGGLASRFGGGVGLQLRARYGLDDHIGKGAATLEWQSPRFGVRLFGQRDYRDAGDVQERSGVVNSLAAQEFGADVSDPYWTEGFGVGLDARDIAGGLRLRLDLTRERQRALAIRATPASGSFPRLIAATPLRSLRASFVAERPTALSIFGSEVRATSELRVSRLTGDDESPPMTPTTVGRAFASVTATRPFGRNRLDFQASGGAVGASGGVAVPEQEWLYFGGPVSAPGYAFHELATLAGASARVEWRTPIPAPAVSLGRFGKVPGEATLAPFVQATFARPALATDLDHPTRVYPSAGIALQPFFDLLRIQVARGLRNGRWTFDVDVSRDFWGIL
ncbi:MAG: hypothetical protein M3Z10_09725, partial [Gemmatimonadota bacterium]|nr:hypothetical protein [Gemmatimonadota bacterium]